MTHRPDERTYHTRLGWWVMTHDRGGAGRHRTRAAVVLIADLLYAASHWTGSFPRAFLVSLVWLAAVASISLALRSIVRLGVGAHFAGTSGEATSCS